MNSHKGFSDRDDGDEYRLVNADPATILNSIKTSNYGDHNLVVYPCLGQFEEFYVECYKDSIFKRKAIFILVTYYQQVSVVRKKMYATGINATRYENDGTIVILDSETAYNPNLDKSEKFNINTLTSMMIKQVRAHDRKGIA